MSIHKELGLKGGLKASKKLFDIPTGPYLESGIPPEHYQSNNASAISTLKPHDHRRMTTIKR